MQTNVTTAETWAPLVRPGDPYTLHARKLLLLRSGHPEVRKLNLKHAEGSSSLYGDRIWDSSILLMSELSRGWHLKDDSHMMDIGCGAGPLAVFAARRFACRVTAVDADPGVFPYVQLHAGVNQVTVETLERRFEDLRDELSDVDLMAGADICLWEEQVPVLYSLICRALIRGVQYIHIADPGRAPFQHLAQLCQDHFGARAWVKERRTRVPYLMHAQVLTIKGN